MGRASSTKDVELLVLRQEVAVIRRINPRLRMDWADRAAFGARIRRLPTRLRAHRLVTRAPSCAGTGTYQVNADDPIHPTTTSKASPTRPKCRRSETASRATPTHRMMRSSQPGHPGPYKSLPRTATRLWIDGVFGSTRRAEVRRDCAVTLRRSARRSGGNSCAPRTDWPPTAAPRTPPGSTRGAAAAAPAPAAETDPWAWPHAPTDRRAPRVTSSGPPGRAAPGCAPMDRASPGTRTTPAGSLRRRPGGRA
jgi:hypothetical protein